MSLGRRIDRLENDLRQSGAGDGPRINLVYVDPVRHGEAGAYVREPTEEERRWAGKGCDSGRVRVLIEEYPR